MWSAPHSIDQPSHWDGLWDAIDIERSVAALRAGADPLAPLIDWHLGHTPVGRGLDHGCGFGRVARYLMDRGWSMTGIDFAPIGLKQAQSGAEAPALVSGDVRELPFDDDAFDFAVSIGVVEHLREGPNRALTELQRVLRPSAHALLTVPFDNPVRRLRGRGGRSLALHGYRVVSVPDIPEDTPAGFYQYAFTKPEMRAQLESAGFIVQGVTPYGIAHGLSDWSVPRRVFDRLSRSLGNADPRSSKSAPSQPNVSKAKRYLRDVYDENGRNVVGRAYRGLVGSAAAHMLAFHLAVR